MRGMPSNVYENGVNQRVVVIEFPSVAAAVATHDGAGYQAALKALNKGVDREIRIAEGLEQSHLRRVDLREFDAVGPVFDFLLEQRPRLRGRCL